MFFFFFHLTGVNKDPPLVRSPRRRLSAELEARGRLDGVEQFVPHQLLVAELGQFEEVHAGAGGGQTLQVVPSVMDAEGGIELLRRNHRGTTGEPQINNKAVARVTDKQKNNRGQLKGKQLCHVMYIPSSHLL